MKKVKLYDPISNCEVSSTSISNIYCQYWYVRQYNLCKCPKNITDDHLQHQEHHLRNNCAEKLRKWLFNFHSNLISLVCMIYWTVGLRTILGFHDCFKTIKWGKIRGGKTKSRELRCFCGILFLNAFLQSSWKERALMGNWRPTMEDR